MSAAHIKILNADWAAIAVVIFGATAFSISQGLTYPLISLILTARDVPPGIIGLNGACFAAGLALATLLVGPITTVLRGHRLIVAGLLGVSVSLAILASSDALWVWFVARFILGFCASIIFMISEAWLNTACPDHLRGRVSGLYGAGICAGFAAGPMAIPLFGTDDGFAFALLAVYIAFVAFASIIICRKATTEPEAATSGMFLQFVFRAPMLVCMVLAFGFADIAAISGMPIYFTELGYSPAFAAMSVTMMALPTAIAQPLVGYLLDKVSRPLIAVITALVAGLGFLIVPLLESETALLVNFAIIGSASVALYTTALTLLGERYSGGMLVAGSAAFALAYSVGSAGGSTTFGVAMQAFSPAAAPLTVGCVTLAFGAAFAIVSLRKGT
ncbi:MAG: putative MFS-type transporter ycaD [Rhizobium sp.]|nr:putative MFS-type transporter ycaD [Rhizobium sp.]